MSHLHTPVRTPIGVCTQVVAGIAEAKNLVAGGVILDYDTVVDRRAAGETPAHDVVVAAWVKYSPPCTSSPPLETSPVEGLMVSCSGREAGVG